MKVVVVGSGIGGISAAFHLSKDGHDVILLEKNSELGGHAYAVKIDGEEVDMGFMMFGDSNPNIKQWFKSLNLTNEDGTTNTRIPMSMSVTSDVYGDVQFSSRHPFASFTDLFDVQLWRILVDIYKFTVSLLTMPDKAKMSTREWSQQSPYSHEFFRHYFLPFVAILWTIPKQDVMDLPASQFLRCLKTHAHSLYMPWWQVVMGVLGRRMDRPKHLWWYIGSKYRPAFQAEFEAKGGQIRLNSHVLEVGQGGKYVKLEDGERITCDYVVLAGHADESAKLIAWSPWANELNRYQFHHSMMYVHRDPQFLPKHKKAWSSWNVRITENDEYIMTYWLNRIQRLKSDKDLFVTITPLEFTGPVPAPDSIIMKFRWDHPRLLADCIPMNAIIQEDGIALSGAWLGRGFHEDGFVAGRRAAWIVKDAKHAATELYKDPDNIPIPPVPPFDSMPYGISLFFATCIAFSSAMVYHYVVSS